MELTKHDLSLDVLRIGKSSGERAVGVHASDIYGSLYKQLDPKRFGRPGDPPPFLLEMGLIFEQMLEEGLKRRFEAAETHEQIERPGEFHHTDTWDGVPVSVHYNPDLFIYNGVLRVGEIKATWMSDIDDILDPKFDKYFTQIKFYCKMLGTRFARLYVFFVCGNYKPPTVPRLKAWDLEFTEDELDMNYAMLMNHAIYAGIFGTTTE